MLTHAEAARYAAQDAGPGNTEIHFEVHDDIGLIIDHDGQRLIIGAFDGVAHIEDGRCVEVDLHGLIPLATKTTPITIYDHMSDPTLSRIFRSIKAQIEERFADRIAETRTLAWRQAATGSY